MLANKVEQVPDDLNSVRLAQDWELRFWCARFNVKPDDLHAAVREGGQDAGDVEKRLREAGHAAFSMGGED